MLFTVRISSSVQNRRLHHDFYYYNTIATSSKEPQIIVHTLAKYSIMSGASQEAAESSPRQTRSMRSTYATLSSKVTGVTNLSVIGITNDGFIKATEENVSIESQF